MLRIVKRMGYTGPAFATLRQEFTSRYQAKCCMVKQLYIDTIK